MSGLVRVVLPALLLLSATGVLPGAPGAPAAACGSHLLAAQDDADTATDAPDARSTALLLPEPSDYAGALQYGAPEAPGDLIDWYAFQVGPETDLVMVELHAYLLEPLFEERLVVDVVPPGAEDPVRTVPVGDGRIGVAASEGEWSFAIRFSGDLIVGDRCQDVDPAAPLLIDEALLQRYVFYVGCDPVC